MDKKEAIEAIRNNWPDSRYSMLRESLEIAIAAIEESMVQKPPHNSKSVQCEHSFEQIPTMFRFWRCTKCGAVKCE